MAISEAGRKQHTRDENSRKPCIAYAAGPGDIVRTFSYWRKGEPDPTQVAVTYSEQFFEVCRKLGLRGVAFSSCPRAASAGDDDIYVENIPTPDAGSGLGFHLARTGASLKAIRMARAHSADLLLVSDATGHWFPFSFCSARKLPVIPTIHCVLWNNELPPSKSRKLLNLLERPFFGDGSAAVLCVSDVVASQVVHIAGKEHPNLELFHGTYRQGTFDDVAPPPDKGRGFSVFYAGRMEPEKGIFDLLGIARSFRERGEENITFDLAGDGSAEHELRRQVEQAGLKDNFRVHGYCDRAAMLELLGKSHIVVVPTRREFNEGFNKVVVESILCGRPVITSSACPAISLVRKAAFEVPPDDPAGYAEAILTLRDDEQLYREKRTACDELAARFYDPARSWGHALELVLKRVLGDALNESRQLEGSAV